MKKLLFSASILMLLLTSCGNQAPNEHNHETHQHEDGYVHADHDSDPPAQEEFTIEADSTAPTEDTGHSHDDGHTHEL